MTRVYFEVAYSKIPMFHCDHSQQGRVILLNKIMIFKYFWSLSSVSSRFWAGQGITFTGFRRNGKSIFCGYVSKNFNAKFERSG